MKGYNINSFADNVAKLTENVNVAISILNGISDSMISQSDTITVDVPGDASVTLPSHINLLNRVKNVENTVSAFTSGQGSVKLLDGTHRNVEVTTIPSVPEKISNVGGVTTFGTDSNWFFESLVFPKIVVNVDLKGKVSDEADRIYVNRVILDLSSTDAEDMLAFYNAYIAGSKMSYTELVATLTANNVPYYEDIETINYPMTYEKYSGKFTVVKKEVINGQLWYYLDKFTFGINSSVGINILNNYELSKGDKLRYENTLYEIVDINKTLGRVRFQSVLGLDKPGVNSEMHLYNEPFAEKYVKIPVGYNEINCIYLKGIDDNFNVIASEWSEPICFVTNDLVYDGDNNITLTEYYNMYVSDFGSEWIAKAKEHQIQAYNGKVPSAPSLVANDFKVVQINTHINSALDENEIKDTYSSIETAKSNISSLRNSIANRKSDLMNETDAATRKTIQAQINYDTNALNNAISEYTSLVNYLNTYISDTGAAVATPKYRVRGFFAIPESQYTYTSYDANGNVLRNIGEQKIIGFDLKYRYLKTDETGEALNTFTYTDMNQNAVTGVFSDWNTSSSKLLERRFNADTGLYEWVNESVSDGNVININQIDIPITDGEKVEFKVRAISEAGYPSNPLKSNWSNSVIISFPSNLSTTDQLTNILNDVRSEVTSAMLDNVLRGAGFYSHIDDETVSANDANVLYHHNTDYIMYKNVDSSTNEVKSMSLTSKIAMLEQENAALVKKAAIFDTSIGESLQTIETLTGTINDLLGRIEKLEKQSGGKPTTDTSTNTDSSVK